MKKYDYEPIVITMPGKSILGMSEEETNKHMEAAWNELRTKTLARGIPFEVTIDTCELPDGTIVAWSDLLRSLK